MLIGTLILALALAPLVALLGCLVLRRPRISEALNLIASAISFACTLPLPFLVDGREMLFWGDYVIIDRASAWIILCTSIVYLLASIYAVGYMRLLREDERLFRRSWVYVGHASQVPNAGDFLTARIGTCPVITTIGIESM